MNSLSITIIIPYYKNRNNLELILRSLCNQTITADEIIIVDDASPEDISDIIKKFNGITYLRRNTNGGVAAARNDGLTLSKSDITMFIDSDAIPELRMIESIRNSYLSNFEDNNMVGIGGRVIECRIETIYDIWRTRHASQDFGIKFISNAPFLFGACCSYKTKFLKNIGGFDPSFSQNVGEDFELGIRIRKSGYRVGYSPDVIINHQHKDNNLSLLNGQYLWSYWELVALKKHNINITVAFLGHIVKFLKAVANDLLIHFDFPILLLDIKIFLSKFKGLIDASKYTI